MEISLVIPMYNESKIIKNTVQTLSEYMQENFQSYEIIFSDDGSTDGCGDIVRSLDLPNVCVVDSKENRGKGHAVRKGIEQAIGDIVMFTDADLAYGTEVIKNAHNIISSSDCGVLIGSRNLNKDGYGAYPPLREKMSKAYIRILCKIGGLELSDSQCGCKAFKREAAKEIFSLAEIDGFAFDLESILLAQKMGIGISEFPVKVTAHPSSSVSLVKDGVKMLKDIVKIKQRIKKMKK